MAGLSSAVMVCTEDPNPRKEYFLEVEQVFPEVSFTTD